MVSLIKDSICWIAWSDDNYCEAYCVSCFSENFLAVLVQQIIQHGIAQRNIIGKIPLNFEI